MKRIIISLTCLGIISISSSCKKYLETTPTDFATTGTYYSTPSQVDMALAGVYSMLRNASLTSSWMTNANAASDESYYLNGNVQAGPASFTNVPTNGVIAGYWDAAYQAINYANTFIANIDNAKTLDPVKKNNALGEAYFLRGYFYYMLVQYFGGVPLRLVPATTVAEGQIARSSAKEVYDQIIADMTKAEGLLQNQTFASLGYSERVTADACQGMLARVCLHAAGFPANDTKRYADAKMWAQKLISSGKHSLVTSFSSLFVDEAKNRYNNETIFEIGYQILGAGAALDLGGPVGQNIGVRMTGGFTTPFLATDSGYCTGSLQAQARLYKAYSPGDLRRDRTVGNYTYVVTSNSISQSFLSENQIWERYPAKWRRGEEDQISKSTRNETQTNFPLLRYADVLLMLAEAENELNGPTADAYNAVNLVRRRAYATANIVDHVNVTNDPATRYNKVPVITVTGGGGTGATAQAFITNNQISSITITSGGIGYSSAPTVTIGLPWIAGNAYALNDQVFISNRLYNVTTAGTATTTAPTNTSGSSSAATTGAVFSYTGVPASATAVLSNHLNSIDAPAGLTQAQFRQFIRDERFRELAYECVRYQDLVRWGILYSTVVSLATDINGQTPGIPATPASLFTSAIIPVNNISPNQVLWPIPSKEMLLNTKMVQNPGY